MKNDEQLKGLNPDLPVQSPQEGLVHYDTFDGQMDLRRRVERDHELMEGLAPPAAAVAPLLMTLARLAARQDVRESQR